MSKTRTILICVVASAVGIGLGVVIGYFSHPSAPSNGQPEEDLSILKKLMDEMKSENIRENLK